MKEKTILREYKKRLNGLNILSLILLVGLGFWLFLVTDCKLHKKVESFECSLVRLEKNANSGYYDAIIKIKSLSSENTLKTNFVVFTPTSSYELTDLSFMEDGQGSERLEVGDVFAVPLRKPDWKISIRGQNGIQCVENFWEMLPVDEQWHPTKSEAMEVAQSIEVESVSGLPKPVAKNLPEEWQLTDEKLPEHDDPTGCIIYQKLRAEEVKEEVYITYSFLTQSEIKEISLTSDIQFLSGWADWTKKSGKLTTIAGHNVIYWDMQDMGEFGWAFRYAYIDSEMVIQVDINADPLEWVKTDQEKILEGKVKNVLLRYGIGPVGELEWQIMIEIRMNGEGTFNKRSKEGEVIQKTFHLDDRELGEIQKSINENRFRELQSRSGLPGGKTSFLSVKFGDEYHTVELKNVAVPFYQNIERTIQKIVLPKVKETIK
jgi:hypothetical protein